MKLKSRTLGFLIILFAISVMAGNALSVPQDDRTRQQRQQRQGPPQDDRTRQQRQQRQRPPQDDRTANRQNANNNDDKEKNKDIKAQ